MNRYFLSFALIGFLCADDKSVNLGEINVKTSGEHTLETLWQELPTKQTSVISKNVIQTNGTSGGVQKFLENAPGILYSRSGGIGGQISFRGQNSNNSRSIIAVDGVRVTGRSTLELNMIDPNSLEAVEIIRGGASTMYGSNSMNGVVNFRTRRYKGDTAKPFEMEAKIRSVEYNGVNSGYGARAELIGGGDGWDILLGIHGRKGIDFRTPIGRAKNSKFKSIGTDFNIGYNFDDTRIYTQGKVQKVNTFNAGGIHSKPGVSFGTLRQEDPMYEYYIRAGLEMYNLGFADKMDAYAYWRRYDTDLWIDRRSIGAAYIHNKVYNTNQVGANLSFDSNLANHDLHYGISYLGSFSPTQTTQVNMITNKQTRSSRDTYVSEFAAFINDNYAISDALSLNAALRYDLLFRHFGDKKTTAELKNPNLTKIFEENNNKTTSAFSGNLGVNYALNDNFSLMANVSRNFKSPGVTGFFISNQDTEEPNYSLTPETAMTYEIGARYSDENNYASLVFYRTDYKDMISSVPNAVGNKSQYQNIGRAQIQGIEWQSSSKFDKFGFDLNMAYTYGQDKSKDKPLSYIAPFYAIASLSYDMPFATAKWTQRTYLGKNRIDESAERKTPSYSMSDISMIFKLGYFDNDFKDMYLTIGVDNLFDKKAANPVTQEDIKYARALSNPLLEPGRNAFIKFTYDY